MIKINAVLGNKRKPQPPLFAQKKIPQIMSSLAACTTLVIAPWAISQDNVNTRNGAELASLEEVVVTGSRLIRSGLVSPVPVTSLSANEIQASGATSLGDLMTELPSMANSSIGRTTNGGLNAPSEAGAALLDLRGLGVNRTLVMINGKRHVGASAASVFGSTSVDINSIPIALIERVEVTTGGGSVSYGADAVSGVVNVILKDDFEGFEVEARGGVSSEEDARNYFISATGGTNFGNDRGNVVFNVTRDSNKGVNSAFDRDYFANQQVLAGNLDPNGPAFVLGPATTTPLGNIPGVIIGLSLDTFSLTGTKARFADDGSIVPFVHGEPTGTAGRERGGDGFDLRDTYQILTPLDRTSFQTRMTYELHPNINFFVDAKYYNSEALSQGQSAADIVTFAGQQGDLMLISPDNPYLPMTDFGAEVFGDAAANNELLLFSGFHLDMGFQASDVERSTRRIVTGLNGEVTDKDWSYEVYYQYGETQEDISFINTRDMVRFQLAYDATVDEAGVVPGNSPGDIGCASTVAAYTGNPGGGSSNPDVNACVPINIFGNGNYSQEALDYVLLDAFSKGRVTQEVFGANLAGDLFELFEAGPLSFAAGLEQRKETASYKPDAFSLGVRTEGDAPEVITGGSYDVFEGYLELAVPLLADRPFIKELSVEGGIRMSDYSSVGNELAWRVGGDWAPTADVRVRGIYAESVRAPNITELFAPQQLGAADIKDPCTSTLVNEGPNPARRLANCKAQLAPLGLDPTTFVDPQAGISQSTIEGGNPNLEVETAKTLTVGLVITPQVLPDLSVTLDFFDIEIEDAVSAIDPQRVVDNCIDNFDSIDNPFCNLFNRATATTEYGRLDNIQSSLLNFQGMTTRGLDYEVRYNLQLSKYVEGNAGNVSFRLIGTYLDEFSVTSGPGVPVDNSAGEIGRPEHRFSLNTTYYRDSLAVNWTARFIGSGELDVDRPELASNFQKHDAGSQMIHDLQVKYQFDKLGAQVYLGVNNLFNAEPPIMALPFAARNAGISETTNITAGLYDLMGTYYYGGVRMRF